MKEARPTTVEERIQIAKDCIANGGNYGETALKFNVSYQQVYQWVKVQGDGNRWFGRPP